MAKGEKKKSKWWIIIVVFIIIGIAGSSEDSENLNENPKKVSSAGEEDAENVEDAEVEETEPIQTEFVSGDVLETEDLRISYLNCGVYTNYDVYSAPESGNKVVFMELECENISDSDKGITTWDFNCYADGYECEEYIFHDLDTLSATLSPGKKAKGVILYEVPQDATEIIVEYEADFWTQDKIVFVIQ